MNRLFLLAGCLLLLMSVTAHAAGTNNILQRAATRLGTGEIQTILYSGSGYDFALGQNANPYIPYPRFKVGSYKAWIDYTAATLKEQRVRSQFENPIRGGSQQPLPERTEVLLVKGDTAIALRDGMPGPVPSPAGSAAQLPVWLTPHGFVRKAIEMQAAVETVTHSGDALYKVSFVFGRFPVTGYIDQQGYPKKVATYVPNDLYGDMQVELFYDGYRDYNGVQFPSSIEERQAGFPTLQLKVDSVQTGVAVAVELPERRPPPPGGPRVTSEQVAEGVWLLTGGPHNSVAVEFSGFIAVVEAPLGEWLSVPVIEAVKKLIPGKPIRYLVNTHHHYDHAAGFRTYAAEGAIIVTHAQNLAFYRELMEAPRTLSPDRLSQSGRQVQFETLTYYHEISDGKRTMEIHLIQGDQHSDGMLMAYLPEEKILIQADVYNPGIPLMSAAAPAHPFSVNLYRNIQVLQLDVEKIIPIHGPIATIGDLQAHVKLTD